MKRKYLLLLATFILATKQNFAEMAKTNQSDANISLPISGEFISSYGNEMGDEEQGLYDFYVNGRWLSRMYPTINKDGKTYLSMYDFVELLNLSNFKKSGSIFTINIGIDTNEIAIDTDKEEYTAKNRIGSGILRESIAGDIIVTHGAVYIEGKTFSKIFSSDVAINSNELTIRVATKFETPEDIEIIIRNRANQINDKKVEKNKNFQSEGELFGLGNARFTFNQEFNQTAESSKIEKSWNGRTEYAGALLNGTFTTSYDFSNEQIQNAELHYSEIIKGHSFTLNNYTGGGNNRRYNGLSFRKERNYYDDGKTVTIRERVPLGSTVELIYLGTSLDIQTAEDGIVEFSNSALHLDRTYFLKVYTPSGEIYTQEIKTATIYNQQNKGEFEYAFNLKEHVQSDTYDGDAKIYYGVTENLTLSGGITRNVVNKSSKKEETEDENGNTVVETINNGDYRFNDRINGEIIYSNTVKGLPYTLGATANRSLNSFSEERDGVRKDSKDDHEVGINGTININDLKLQVRENNKGEYHDEKRKREFDSRYRVFGSDLELLYKLTETEKYPKVSDDSTSGKKKEVSQEYGLNISKNYGEYSVIGSYTTNDKQEDNYKADIYVNKFEKVSVRVGADYTPARGSNGEDKYNMTASIRNKGWSNRFDYSIDATYGSDKDKRVGISFSTKVDDWFTFDGGADRAGNRNIALGVDKIVSLKAPLEKINDIQSSRGKITTFVDLNGNGIRDFGEETAPEVKVVVADYEVITDENGVAYVHGLSKGIQYDVKVVLNNPEHYLHYDTMKVTPKHVSEITMDIPIRPMVTLEGFVSLEKLGLEEEEDIVEVYNNIIISILDENGKELEVTVPEDTGEFQVSGLFTEKYFIKIQYLGASKSRSSIEMVEKIELAYDVRGRKNRHVFNLVDKYSYLYQEKEESNDRNL